MLNKLATLPICGVDSYLGRSGWRVVSSAPSRVASECESRPEGYVAFLSPSTGRPTTFENNAKGSRGQLIGVSGCFQQRARGARIELSHPFLLHRLGRSEVPVPPGGQDNAGLIHDRNAHRSQLGAVRVLPVEFIETEQGLNGL